MSRNPAWNKYNETVREINAAYDAAVEPERVIFRERLKDIEAEYGPKIRTLKAEQELVESKARKTFAETVKAADDLRTEALDQALKIRQAELQAIAEKEAEDKATGGTVQPSVLRKHDRTAARHRTVPA